MKSKNVITNYNDLVITKWSARFNGQTYPCAIGRNGIGQKIGEGDGITPIGQFRVMGCGFRPDRIKFHSPAMMQRPIRLFDIWSDDPKDPDYNHGLRAFDHPFSHEKLRRADGLYDAFAILDYNFPQAEPGKGSAIFLHIWRKPRHPTEGCVAFDPLDFAEILMRWTPQSRVVIK